jgi:hypothetical protein
MRMRGSVAPPDTVVKENGRQRRGRVREPPPPAAEHPAHIPREVGGSPRRRPAIRVGQRTKSPALATNPRLARASPGKPSRAVTPEVAGSSPVAPVLRLQRPANMHVLLSAKARTTAGFPFHPAHIAHGNPRSKPGIAANSRNSAYRSSGRRSSRSRCGTAAFAGTFLQAGSAPACIPLVIQPALTMITT